MILKPYFADFADIEFGKKDDPVLRPGVKESMSYACFCHSGWQSTNLQHRTPHLRYVLSVIL